MYVQKHWYASMLCYVPIVKPIQVKSISDCCQGQAFLYVLLNQQTQDDSKSSAPVTQHEAL